ncbi:DUF4188 domain-containing protein [Streptomonospora litoralis]|uniref:DUF4188 domain-containing protein n=1 Tax=Streptomonospora litoralis TaxID=2498135 RepID=A0A4P6Q190_9ACTN|nr:DUF4188 domain-containing protein [Streptomonospora litoralis]QBI52981.1 hypothetical protein EKD16_05905 [Streptomonospora litoralis]
MSDTTIPRLTTEPRESLTVFLLGARVNALLKPHSWVWVVRAFSRMAAELQSDPSRGLLHSRTLPSMFGVTVVQYWESTEALLRYAHDETHSAAWRRYYRQGGDAVGLWHETYEVGLPQSGPPDPAGAERPEEPPTQTGRGYEAIYANMPTTGLGRALGTRPIDRGTRRALDRMALRRARNRPRTEPGTDDHAHASPSPGMPPGRRSTPAPGGQ